MGAKIHKRRKICALIAGAFLFVSAIFAVVMCAGTVNPKKGVELEPEATKTIDKSSDNSFTYNFDEDDTTYTFKLRDSVDGKTPVYYVEIAGADGGGGTGNAGRGAVVYGFYRGSSLDVYGRGYRGNSKSSGGGLTKFTSNFATNGNRTGDIIAGGGGGSAIMKEVYYFGHNINNNTWYNTRFSNNSTGGNAGYTTGLSAPEVEFSDDYETRKYAVNDPWCGIGGEGCTTAPNGTTKIMYLKNSYIAQWYSKYTSSGAKISSGYRTGVLGKLENDYVQSAGISKVWYGTANGTIHSELVTTSGSIPSYTYNVNSGGVELGDKLKLYDLKDFGLGHASGGQGGNCSPSSYPLCSWDYSSVGGYKYCSSTGRGYVTMALMNPGTLPSDCNKDYTGSEISAVDSNGANARIKGWWDVAYGDNDSCIVAGKFYYSTDNKTWKEDVKFKDIGAHTVYWKYVLYGDGGTNRVAKASASNPEICSGSYTFTIMGTTSFNAGSTIKMAGASSAAKFNEVNTSYLTYNGEAQQLISDISGLKKDFGTIYYGVTRTKPSANGTTTAPKYTIVSSTDYKKITAKDADTYYVFYYISATNYRSKFYYQTVVIKPAQPNASGGSGSSVEYTGSSHAIFSGPISVLGGRVAYYRWYNRDTGKTGNSVTLLGDVKPTDPGSYVLQIQFSRQTTNLWYLDYVEGGKNWYTTGVTGYITKASLSVTVNNISFKAARTYNGESSAFMDVKDTPLTIKNSKGFTVTNYDAGTWTFERVHTVAIADTANNLDGVKKVELAGSSANQSNFKTYIDKVNSATNAGTYQLRISWSGTNYIANGSTIITGSHTINRAKVTDNSITFAKASDANDSNNSFLNNPGEPIDLYGAHPVVKDNKNKVTVFYKGQKYDGNQLNSNGKNGAGTLSFCFVKAGSSMPSATAANVWKDGLDNYNVKDNTGSGGNSILDYKISSDLGAGIYSLYFRFKGHNNFTDDTVIKYPTDFRIENYSADNVTLKGLYYNYGGQIRFDGREHQIAGGTFGYDEKFITIKTEAVEYNIWSNNKNCLIGNWTTDLSEVKVRDAGTYSLRVRWGQVPGHMQAGVDYNNVQAMGERADGKALGGVFEVVQLQPTNGTWENLRIEGLDVSEEITFDGKGHSFANAKSAVGHPEEDLIFLIKSSTETEDDGSPRWYQLTDEEVAAWFGKPFNFALGYTDAERYPETNQYVNVFPSATNAGTYKLYIKWAATNNIAGPKTELPYEYGTNLPNDTAKTFKINKTTNIKYSSIAALSEDARTYRTETVSQDVYDDDGNYVGTNRIVQAKAIPLFGFTNNKQEPVISINDVGGVQVYPTQIATGWDFNNGVSPEVTFQYALTASDSIDITYDQETGKYSYPGVVWYDSLEAATVNAVRRVPGTNVNDYKNDSTNYTVAPYYLWILISNDNNIEEGTPICVADAKLLPAEATVAATAFPQANNLTETYETNSNQTIPLNLFMASEQIVPPVEYTLTPNDSDSWIRIDNPNQFPDALKAATTGHYQVYFRGGADINHYTQRPDLGGNYVKAVNDKTIEVPGAQYQFINVVINPPAAGIELHPTIKKDENGKAMEFVYTGRPQLLFDPGLGKTESGGGQFELEYKFTDNEMDEWHTYDWFVTWYENHKSSNYWAISANMRNYITINAGTYTLYYRVHVEEGKQLAENPICQIHLTINKAPIMGVKPGFTKTSASTSSPNGLYLTYDGNPHTTITTEAGFKVVGTKWLNGVEWSNTDKVPTLDDKLLIGEPGKIVYGYSNNFGVPPSVENTFEDFNQMRITNAGTYYLWYKIGAGENHLASDWICAHANSNDSPFIINRALQKDVNLSWSDTFGPELYYTGQNTALISRGELVQKIGSNVVQTAKPNEQFKIWYALMPSTVSPEATSLLWKDSYSNARVSEAGDYYLFVKIAAHTNVEMIISCVNPDRPITFHKAQADNLTVQGITVENLMYQGKPLTMASGALCVNTCDNNKNIVMYNVPYGTAAYVYSPYNDQAHAPSPDADWQTNLYAATCTDAGKYYLWVYLRDSVNLDDVMVCVNADNPAIIRPADETYIEIAPLSLATVTEYSANNAGVAFITSGASLVMNNGGTLGGNPGTAYYLLRAGADKTLPNITRDETVENLINQGWTSNFANVRANNVGVYQIFVLFVPATTACNHTFILPQHMGQVEITKASDLTITFSGFDYIHSQTFTAGQLSLVANDSTFIQSINGRVLEQTYTVDGETYNSFGDVLFAASSSATTQPNINDDEWVADINAVKGVTAGYYYIWVWVKEGTNIAEYRACLGLDSSGYECAVIEQRTNVNSVLIQGVNPVENLVFDDTYQELATEELTVKINNNNVPLTMLGMVSWALTEGATAGAEPQDSDWHTSLDEITARDANYDDQFYWLWIRITATDNVAEIVRSVCQIKISRAEIEFYNLQAAAGLSYNGSEQCLLDWTNHGASNFGQVVYRLTPGGSLDNANDWSTNWQDMIGVDAGSYNVYCAVLRNRNWEGKSIILDDIEIAAATASFYDLPTARYTIYTGTMQDLVEFGSLTEDAIAQGVTINFRYHKNGETEKPDYVGEYRDENNSSYYENIWYTYQGDDVWDAINKKLPGGVNAGTYTIEYYTTASTQRNANGTFNFTESAVSTITATMQRRTLYWYTEPTAKQGLRDTGKLQDLLNAGEPSVRGATGLTVQYTNDPNDSDSWLSGTWVVPQNMGIGRYYSYYRVYFNSANNVFWDGNREWNEEDAGADGIVYTDPIELVTLIEKLTISFRRLPEGVSVSYDAEPHTLVNFGELSTFLYGDTYSNVYLEYRYEDDDGKWYAAEDFPQKTAVGQYKIEYRVHGVSDDYSSNKTFEFVGNDKGYIYSEIMAASVTGNGIRAVLVNDDQIDFTIGFEVSDTYSEDFKAQLQAADVVTYRFRAIDHPDYWHDWQEFHTGGYKNKMGVYQIQARITADSTANSENFDPYEQTEDFYEFKITKNLVLNIHVEGYSTRPLVQAWVDTTGSQSFSDAEYTSGEASISSTIVIPNCASSGVDGSAKIRVRCLNDKYYYLSNSAITDHQKTSLADGIVLSESLVDKGILSVELGLNTDIYIYEVYKVAYAANFEVAAGNSKPTMTPSWKWHSDHTGDSCEYPLALELDPMNVFAHPLGLKFNGWNVASSGLSDEKYNSSNRYYTENRSVVLYAQWNSGVEIGLVRWQVGDYEITGSDVWFNFVQDPTRNNVGKEVNWGTQIYLPDISSLPDAATNGKYIVKWVVKGEEDSNEFFWNRTVDREEITFVAVLSNDNKYINCVFMNDKNIQVSSVIVADGAEGYMAFSGLTANDFKRYDYQQFVDELTGRNHILHAKNDDRVKIFNVGAENVVLDDESSDGANYQTAGEFTAMIIIIAFGVLLAVGSMVVYLMIRNKKIKINFKHFREDKTI